MPCVMRQLRLRSPIARLTAAGLLLAGPAAAQDEAAPTTAPPLRIEEISVEPQTPAADTLCRLQVKISNGGERIASRLGFAVSLNGQDLGVYGNQIFLYPVAPGTTEEIALYNFWTTETSRAMPADGKLRVEVTLREAVWTEVATETDEEGEIEVWTPIGPVEGLPVKAAITVQMKTG
jgi:hypothetical protein